MGVNQWLCKCMWPPLCDVHLLLVDCAGASWTYGCWGMESNRRFLLGRMVNRNCGALWLIFISRNVCVAVKRFAATQLLCVVLAGYMFLAQQQKGRYCVHSKGRVATTILLLCHYIANRFKYGKVLWIFAIFLFGEYGACLHTLSPFFIAANIPSSHPNVFGLWSLWRWFGSFGCYTLLLLGLPNFGIASSQTSQTSQLNLQFDRLFFHVLSPGWAMKLVKLAIYCSCSKLFCLFFFDSLHCMFGSAVMLLSRFWFLCADVHRVLWKLQLFMPCESLKSKHPNTKTWKSKFEISATQAESNPKFWFCFLVSCCLYFRFWSLDFNLECKTL